MNTAPYAPDNLALFGSAGDSLLRGIENKPTLFNVNDVRQGVGGDSAKSILETMQDNFTSLQSALVGDSGKNGTTEQAINTNMDDCSQYPVGSNDWMFCKGKSIGSGIGGSITKPLNDALNRTLFGVLGVLVVGFGLYYFAQD